MSNISSFVKILPLNVCVRAQSCLTVLRPHGLQLPGSSIHGIFQARILEWIAISFFRVPSQSAHQPVSLESPSLVGRFFTTKCKYL